MTADLLDAAPPPMLHVYERILAAPTRRWVGALALIGALPVALAFLDGTFRDVTVHSANELAGRCAVPKDGIVFRGAESAPNWWIFIPFLPLAFLLLRSALRQTVGERDGEPPVATLVNESRRNDVAKKVRERLASARLPLTALGMILAIAAYDSWDVVRTYVTVYCPREKDWTVFFIIRDQGTSRALNALHVGIAYGIQYALGFAALLIFVLALVHNVSYLNLVYQRRHGDDASRFITLTLDDPDCYFGQGPLVPGFRLQVMYLVLAGIAVSFSRYANVDLPTMQAVWRTLETEIEKRDGFEKILGLYNGLTSLDWSRLFPDSGQWTLAVAFIAVFLIVGVPSLVKFLPFQKKNMWALGPKAYLAEFIPPGSPREPSAMNREELKKLAGEFAANSFWPAGDPVAQKLFVFVYVVMIFIMFPVPVRPWRLVGFYALCIIALALTLTGMTFFLYRWLLATVSDDLVRKPDR